jgi:SAM-dependent methyltransferase
VPAPQATLLTRVRAYWDQRIHDLEISKHPPGSPGFFSDLDEYHFQKLHHLPRLVDFDGWRGRRVLDVGCGAGIDLARFARSGARGVGVDLAHGAARLALTYVRQQSLPAGIVEANGASLPFPSSSFDFVFAHGVIQYAPDDGAIVGEVHRVLKPGGQAVFQVYNRVSWLNALSKVMKVGLEHEDAPVLRKYTIGEFRRLLSPFVEVRIVSERFPVKSRLHGGWKGAVYNGVFVGTFNALPRSLVERYGWHLLGFCRKGDSHLFTEKEKR